MNVCLHVYEKNNFAEIENAHVTTADESLKLLTDSEGRVIFAFNSKKHSPLTISATNYIPRQIHIPHSSSPLAEELDVELSLIPPADNHLGWWHKITGIKTPATDVSAIKIGVIDSGCSDHPDLVNVSDCGCFVSSGHCDSLPGRDTQDHGTGVIGLLASRPNSTSNYRGFAEGATILSIKAFDEKTDEARLTGTQHEINGAIQYFIEKKVHFINCSFELDDNLESMEKMVQKAFNHGILCICAAGNHRDISFPARCKPAIAVSAMGLRTGIPLDSLLEKSVPDRESGRWQKDYFVPTFSGRGTQLNCCAPGVGIITPCVPRNGIVAPYQIVSGTSFATPIVCGILARVFGSDQTYLGMGSKIERANYAVTKLGTICKSLGFPRDLEGNGLPTLNGQISHT